MIRIFKTIDGKMHQMEEACEGCWVALTNPTATEIFEICNRFQIEVDDLRAPLDEEERSRIEVEENYTLILVDTPIIEERGDKDWFGTIPLSIIITNEIDFYSLSGRYIGSWKIHGRACTQFLYLYENAVYFTDSV